MLDKITDRSTRIILVLAVILAAILLQGCGAIREQVLRDPRDAAWDPKQGQLFEQIPNWDGNAERVCCGHLRVCEPHQSPRC
jgi:hypothetical protein